MNKNSLKNFVLIGGCIHSFIIFSVGSSKKTYFSNNVTSISIAVSVGKFLWKFFVTSVFFPLFMLICRYRKSPCIICLSDIVGGSPEKRGVMR